MLRVSTLWHVGTINIITHDSVMTPPADFYDSVISVSFRDFNVAFVDVVTLSV